MSDPDTRANNPQISLFPNHSVTIGEPIALNDALDRIQGDFWKIETGLCREARAAGVKAYKAARESLPAFTLSGSMKHRRKGHSWASRSFVHSGLIQGDLDAADHPDLSYEEMRSKVEKLPWTVAAFRSVGGDGVKVVIRCRRAANEAEHRACWRVAARRLKEVGLNMDPKTKDPVRLCYVSHDPDFYHNPDAEELDKDEIEEELKNSPADDAVKPKGREVEGICPEHVERVLRQIAEKIDYPDYDDWIKIASATFSAVGVATGVEIMDEVFPDPEERAHERLAESLDYFIPWDTVRAFDVDPTDPQELLACLPDLPDAKDTGATEAPDLLQRMNARRFNLDRQPEKPPSILTLAGYTLCTPGNITNIQATLKAGKSAVVGAIIAAAIQGRDGKGDCLGFASDNPEGLALIHFDTEQSPFDHDLVVRRSLRRAGVTVAPHWLMSYALADFDIKDRQKALALALAEGRKKCGGVLAVLIDGIGDLCAALNDDRTSFALVASLHTLAIRYNTGILTVLHENPGSDIGKTRGHLGSQLERKAETNLRLVKDASGVTTMFSDRSRHCHIPKPHGVCFKWDPGQQAHASIGGAAQLRSTAARSQMESEAGLVFGDSGEGTDFTFSELKERIMGLLQVSESTAKRRIGEWLKAAVISRNESNVYRLGTSSDGL